MKTHQTIYYVIRNRFGTISHKLDMNKIKCQICTSNKGKSWKINVINTQPCFQQNLTLIRKSTLKIKRSQIRMNSRSLLNEPSIARLMATNKSLFTHHTGPKHTHNKV